MRLVTRVQRHLDHLLRARPQFHRRPLQPQSPHMIRNRLTRHRREDAVKMKTRKTRHHRQLLQIQRLIQMLLDMRQHPQNALVIIIPRCLMLWLCAAHLHAKLANAITDRLTNFAVLQLRHFSCASVRIMHRNCRDTLRCSGRIFASPNPRHHLRPLRLCKDVAIAATD